MKKLGPEMQIISPFMKLLVQMKRILLGWQDGGIRAGVNFREFTLVFMRARIWGVEV